MLKQLSARVSIRLKRNHGLAGVLDILQQQERNRREEKPKTSRECKDDEKLGLKSLASSSPGSLALGPTPSTKKLFGAALEPSELPVIPSIISECFQWLEKNALDEEGIFRKSGNTVEVEALKLLYDSKRGEIELSFYSPHTISSLVKSYIRQLPEPLFTYALYDGFIDANLSEDAERLKEFKQLINRLPKRNAAILRFVFLSLQKFVSHSSKNMMIASNLAIVFAPNLLRAEKETYQQVVFHSSALNAIVTTMIEKAELLFDMSLDEENVPPPPGIPPVLARSFSSRRNLLVASAPMTSLSTPNASVSTPSTTPKLSSFNAVVQAAAKSQSPNLRASAADDERTLVPRRRNANCRSVDLGSSDIANIGSLKEAVINSVAELQDQLADLWVKLEAEQREEIFKTLKQVLLNCLKEISRAEVEKTEEELAREDLSNVTLLDEVKGQLFQLRQCLNLQERMKSFIEINRAVFKVQTEAERLQLNMALAAGGTGSRIKPAPLTTSASPLRPKFTVQITVNE